MLVPHHSACFSCLCGSTSVCLQVCACFVCFWFCVRFIQYWVTLIFLCWWVIEFNWPFHKSARKAAAWKKRIANETSFLSLSALETSFYCSRSYMVLSVAPPVPSNLYRGRVAFVARTTNQLLTLRSTCHFTIYLCPDASYFCGVIILFIICLS